MQSLALMVKYIITTERVKKYEKTVVLIATEEKYISAKAVHVKRRNLMLNF